MRMLPWGSTVPSAQSAQSGQKRRNRQAGFSLLETLVVLVIIALIAGIVAPRLMSQLGGAKTKTARIQIGQLRSAVDLYNLDVGAYPTNEQGLDALVTAPSGVPGWNGPYIEKIRVPLDPWGNAYIYRSPGKVMEFEILSYGADGERGGDGDSADISSAD